MSTIAQISTPLGSGGIAIVRISGDDALSIGRSLFYCKKLENNDITPRLLYLGDFKLDDATEKCMMVYFKSPYSFTGEDVIEFQIHGGEYLATKVLDKILEKGAVLAQNGEFSKRAFLNGKMSLDEAEATIDMINATRDAELKASSRLAHGKLFDEIKKIQDELKDSLANLEVALDYPEHDDETKSEEIVKNILKNALKRLKKLDETHESGEKIKFGIDVAIVGKPNVGKSSILNALLNEDRAIVTDIKGTTRDTLKETINYQGLKINFIDTAGIRESDDIVEKIGVEKSKKSIEESDIVLFVLDSSEEMDKEDKQLEEFIDPKKIIYVLNKSDKKKKLNIDCAIYVSAKENININLIFDEILKKTKLDKINYSELQITNRRHHNALKEAIKEIEAILEEDVMTLDIFDMQIKKIWKKLGEITGETANEAIIDEIFSKFCLGK